LKKPLEGVPGLLLRAALVLFGATIGVSVALVCHWVTMQAEVANFLGGVVGAGLGSAFAVMGAVYVQRRDARARLDAPINQLLTKLGPVSGNLSYLKSFLEPLTPDITQDGYRALCSALVDEIEKGVAIVPDAIELPREIHVVVVQVKHGLPPTMSQIDSYLEHHAERKATPTEHTAAMDRLSAWVRKAASLHRAVSAL
jgi:hypothetical protein